MHLRYLSIMGNDHEVNVHEDSKLATGIYNISLMHQFLNGVMNTDLSLVVPPNICMIMIVVLNHMSSTGLP